MADEPTKFIINPQVTFLVGEIEAEGFFEPTCEEGGRNDESRAVSNI
jgi:hypothetical protein